MSLQVVIIGATNVPNPETFGKCDPYASVDFLGQKKKTQVVKGEDNPTWNESFDFDLQGVPLSGNDEIVVQIKDWERVGRNRLLGTAKIPLRELLKGGQQSKQLTVNLVDANDRPHPSKLTVKVSYNPPAGAKDKDSGGASGGGAKGTVIGQEEEDDEEAEEEGGEEEVTDQVDAATGQPIKRKKKKKRIARRKIRGNLSTKPQDFQVRVKVLQARQLQGANIQPVARVTVYNQTRQTRIKKSTNSPYWNESFFFNFNIAPAELFDELIEFQVFNSRKLRSDSLIGSFKFDVGLVYDEPQHAFINKWLLLSDPEDTMAGAKGYLKICATVLGPGDEAPSMKSGTQDDDEDIESNLLRPAGVQLRPATFLLRLYRAEDIPRMDSAFFEGVKKVFGVGEEQKELVDPYFIMTFAGTEVKSKIMYCCDHPEWNQELKLGLQFPSMCERIKFMMRDWDRLSEDDVIGTFFLPISLISSSGGTSGTSLSAFTSPVSKESS